MRLSLIFSAIPLACGAPPIVSAPAPAAAAVPVPIPAPPPAPPPEVPVAPPPPLACAGDADCGYDPALDCCTADPRANRQPPLVDQGIVCFCSGALTCDALRVPPVPCESDASCAVLAEPRPHPVAADGAHPHERGRPCRDFVFSTTCERTNICTMHRHSCNGGRR